MKTIILAVVYIVVGVAMVGLYSAESTDCTQALKWTAPADNSGLPVVGYDLRYAEDSLDLVNWETAAQVENEPHPSAAGHTDSCRVTGLVCGRVYYFAVKSWDSSGNISAISNIARCETIDTIAPPAIIDLGCWGGK